MRSMMQSFNAEITEERAARRKKQIPRSRRSLGITISGFPSPVDSTRVRRPNLVGSSLPGFGRFLCERIGKPFVEFDANAVGIEDVGAADIGRLNHADFGRSEE